MGLMYFGFALGLLGYNVTKSRDARHTLSNSLCTSSQFNEKNNGVSLSLDLTSSEHFDIVLD